MLKKIPVNMKFVEEEIVEDLKFKSETRGLILIVDSGAPLSIVSERGLKKYIEKKVVIEKDFQYKNCGRRFRFGENIYISMKEVKFPIVVKVEDGDFVKREVTTKFLEKKEELFFLWKKKTNRVKDSGIL